MTNKSKQSATTDIFPRAKSMTRGYQVWSYTWTNVNGPVPDRALFGGHIYATKADAEHAWYDTCPGINDKHVVLRVTN